MSFSILHPPSSILAFAAHAIAQASFDNAIMLAGLGGAVVPLVIHLLGRARYRSVEWGAMMFIDAAAAPRFRDPGRLREWTLLAIRMAAVCLLAVALARPAVDATRAAGAGGAGGGGSGGGAAGAGEPRVAAAIVVDCSASMGYEDVAGTRIEQARRAVLQILSTLKRGDRVALLASAPGAPPAELSGDLQAVAARASDLEPVAGVTDLAATVESAADLLGRQERVSRQLYVITDRQAWNWRGVTDEFADRWRAHAPLARFAVIPVGGGETDNLVIESVAVVNPPVVERCPGEVRVRVRNHGDEPRDGVPLVLRLARREVFATTLNLPPGGVVTTTAAITFAGAGPQELSAEVRSRSGGPPLDDRRTVVVDVSPPLRTLLVRSRRGESAADVLRAALAPPAGGQSGGNAAAAAAAAAVDEVSAVEWDARALDGYRVVVLDDVETLEPRQVAALEQFVYGGGGLVIAPGPAARTNEYNRLMYREEGALLPALLQPPLTPPAPITIDRGSIDGSHPLLHFLAGQEDLAAATVSRFVATTARTPDARILATLSSGDPFMLEAPFGRGRVLLMTSSLRPAWSTLPLTPLYLPLVQSTVRYAAGADVRPRTLAAGAEIAATFEPEVNAARGVVIRPDGSRERCEVVSADGRSEVRYAATGRAGVYTINAGQQSVKFSVVPPAEESDLTPLDEAAWARLQDQLGFTRLEPTARPLAARLVGPGGRGAGDRYWILSLAAVLALFILELGLARTWLAGAPDGGRR